MTFKPKHCKRGEVKTKITYTVFTQFIWYYSDSLSNLCNKVQKYCIQSLEDLLPDISDLCGSHLLILHLHHSKATHSIQEASCAHQVDGAPLLGELSEGFPPAESQHTKRSSDHPTVIRQFFFSGANKLHPPHLTWMKYCQQHHLAPG